MRPHHFSGAKKECLQSCTDQNHILTATASSFPNLNAFVEDQRDFCALFLKLRSSCSNVNKRAILDLYYGEKFCSVIEARSEQFDGCFKWPETNG